MKRIIWSLLAAVVLLAWTCGPVVGQESGPTMQVTAGFDGYCRRDGWCPVYILLSNEGADVEGELYVAVRGASGTAERDVYARPVLLPAHSRKAFFLYLPSVGWAIQPIVRLASGGETLVSQRANVRRLGEADRLYGVMAEYPDFYTCPVDEDSRSYMNVVFRLPSEDLEAQFVAEAKAVGMVGLKGHRSVGGCRASIYNAMPPEGVEVLAEFMEEFARRNG